MRVSSRRSAVASANLQGADRGLAQPFALERLSARGQQRADAAELGDQRLGLRLGVDARNGQRQ
jgi:hypothetical protein